MALKTTEFCLLENVSSVEEFLKSYFSCSSSKLKKYFEKSFLNKSLKARSTLKLPINFINEGMINPVYSGGEITILYEDENFLVMNKLPFQYVHPLSYDESDNCLSYLRSKRPELLNVNQGYYDRGLLYRLDYETSGVLIYVKKEKLYQEMRDNFAVVARKKIYRCWVRGECKLSGSFAHSFSSSGEKGMKVIVGDETKYEQVGMLSLKPIRFDNVHHRTLMEVDLQTGLRHQIRAQLAHLGYPLIGDKLYGESEAPRLYLHAQSYQITTLGNELIFEKKDPDFL